MTLLPRLAADDLRVGAQRELLKPFASRAPSREVSLVHRRSQPRAHLVNAFVEVVLEVLPKDMR